MALGVRTTILLLLVLAVLLTVPVLIGVYVYRDAEQRRMNAVLWTLIAIAAPALIGFIIYLLVRGNDSDLECPQCGAPVTEQYVVCPRCGAKLRPVCPNCAAPVEPDWRVCPRCAAPLGGVEMHPAPPLRRKDRTLNKILIAVIAVPVTLIALFALLFFFFRSSGSSGGSSTLREVTFDEYDREQTSEEVRDAVHHWLDGLELREDRAYALRYDASDDLGSGHRHRYLIYVPAGGQSDVSFGTSPGLFGSVLKLQLERTGYSGSLYCVETSVEEPPTLQIALDGKRIRCDVTVVDYDPTLFFTTTNYATAEPGSAAPAGVPSGYAAGREPS